MNQLVWQQHSSVRDFKRALASREINGSPVGQFQSDFIIHGIDVTFSYDSLRMQSWIEGILGSYGIYELGSHRTDGKQLNVLWQSPYGLKESEINVWNEDPDPNLEIFKLAQCEVAIQRDFMGILKNENHISVFLQPEFSDGLYNSLRWFMPRFLLAKNALMMHSSCLVGEDGLAHLFLGPSGVGKTTTVSRAENRLILGDDMILITLEKDRAFAETPVLGQNPRFKGSAGNKYPLAGFYFLEQALTLNKILLSELSALKHFLLSLMYPTWNSVSELEANKLTQLSMKFLESVPSWKLQLDLNTPFLGVIDGKIR